MDWRHLDDLNPFDLFDAESERLMRCFASLDQGGWVSPTPYLDWTRRDVLAHLAGLETYYQACLDARVGRFVTRLVRAGVDLGPEAHRGLGLGSFGEWSVEQRRTQPAGEILGEWRRRNQNTRRRLRQTGRNRAVQTVAFSALVGRYTFYCAAEYATHADDVGAPVLETEQSSRTQWRARVGLAAVLQEGQLARRPINWMKPRIIDLIWKDPLAIGETPEGYRVSYEGFVMDLSAADLVAASIGRLPDDHPLDPRLRVVLAQLAC
jgi:uncharacterized protein (TIGR03083 family)